MSREGELSNKEVSDGEIDAAPERPGHLSRKRFSRKPKSPKPSSRIYRPKTLITLLVLIAAIVFVRHPKSGPIVVDFLSPAERMLSELDRWGNFTLTSAIRGAISDIFNASSTRVERELPFYIDIISDSVNSTIRRPVFFIPGYITSGLEIWANLPCAKAKFRERIWGTANMVKLFITDPKCWISHMLLEPILGTDKNGTRSLHFTDPVGVRIKPAGGLAAADFVIGDYWVWNPIIEALGYAGYDESYMWMMSYDWRLPIRDLEFKDRFFTRMALEIEKLVKLNGNKVLMITHSFGAKVGFYFLNWADRHLDPMWIENHIFASYNVGPVFLGVPKAISALLSGDTRDTAQLGPLSTLFDSVLPSSDRSALTAAWGSIGDMLPFGSHGVWQHAMLYLNGNLTNPYSVNETLALLFNTSAMTYHAEHSKTGPHVYRCPTENAPARTCYKGAWLDPTISPLPRTIAKMKVWCAYGTGIPTEVGYHYSTNGEDLRENSAFKIDTSISEKDKVINGVILDDGDGTVPIQSLAYMCVEGWRKGSHLNPHGVDVKVRELRHGESYSVLSRSSSAGGSSVDHVDIMGNRFVIRDILQLALGLEHKMEPPTVESVVAKRNITIE